MKPEDILFKAKRVDNGEWVQGSYVWDARCKKSWITYYWEDGERPFEVIPETVCQYTGLTDGDGNKIFEGDYNSEGITVVWRTDIASFALKKKDFGFYHYFGEAMDPIEFEATGNIHDI